MRVLIACEKSQTVCREFRKLGHEAYSCDILPCSIFDNPDWHIQGDVLTHLSDGWDLMIGHPPCQKMTGCGAKHMYKGKKLQYSRLADAMRAKWFFYQLLHAPIPMIAIENPTPLKIVGLPAPTPVIQPYMFGDPYSKRTLLWLKGLAPLVPTNILSEYAPFMQSGGKNAPLSKVRGEARSETFKGIAIAMATQWGTKISQTIK